MPTPPHHRRTFRVAIRQFGPFESALRKQWDAFAAATHCNLHLEPVAHDLHELHATLFTHEGLWRGDFDVAFINTDWLAEAHATGALLDLGPVLQKSPPADFPAGWTDSLLRHQTFGEKILGLPYHDGPECLIYRKDLFDAANLTPPRTWDEFHAIARQLHAPTSGRAGTAFAAFPDGHNTVYDFCLQLWTRGGELFDAHNRLQLTTPAAESALTFYRAILNDPAAVHPACRELDSVKAGLAFAHGEVAMMINWFGFAALGETLADSAVKGRVAIAPIPTGHSRPEPVERASAPGHSSASLNVYWLLGIAAGSPHARTAYDFLKHCASAESDKLLTLEGAIGCRKSTWHDPDVNRTIPFYRELETIHAHARELPRLAHWSKLAEIIDRLVLATINTNDPIASLLAHAQSESDALIEPQKS